MRRASTCLLFGLVVFAFNSCRVPTAPVETANIHGSVELAQDEYLLTPPYSGVTVTLEGTSYSAVTDDSGNFTLHDVPTGTYNVRFSKPGYGDVRWMSTTVTGGGKADVYWNTWGWTSPPYSSVLYRTSKVVTVLDGLRVLDTTLYQVVPAHVLLIASGSVIPDLTRPQNEEALAVYISHTSDVSAQPGHYTAFYYASNNGSYENQLGTYPSFPIDTTAGRFRLLIDEGYLKRAGFKSGDSIYVAAYGAACCYPTPFGDYWDPNLQQWVLTAINQTPSPVIGTIVP